MFQISKVYIGIVPLMTSYERPGFSGYGNVNYKLYKKNRAMFKNRSITVKNSQVEANVTETSKPDVPDELKSVTNGTSLDEPVKIDKTELPSWGGLRTRQDTTGEQNNQRNNSEDLVEVNEGKIEPTDDLNDILMKFIGSGFVQSLSDFEKISNKISSQVWWDICSLEFNWDIFMYKPKNDSFEIKSKARKIVEKFDFTSYFDDVDNDLKFKFLAYVYSPDNGSDFLIKNVQMQDNNARSYVNAERYSLASGFTLPGGDNIAFLPIIRQMGSEQIGTILCSYLLKCILIMVELTARFDNCWIYSKPVSEYSIIGNVKINFWDEATNTPTNFYSSTRKVDGIGTVNLFVPKGKNLEFAIVIHLLCMIETPFSLKDKNSEKTNICSCFNFSKSNKLEEINVYCYDQPGIVQAISMIDSKWWTIRTNVIKAINIYCEYIPHKYSCYHADGLVLSEFLLGKYGFVSEVKVSTQMPINQWPTNIGIFKVVEGQKFGISQNNMNLDKIISVWAISVMNHETLLNSLMVNVFRSLFNTNIIFSLDDIKVQNIYSEQIYSEFRNAMASNKLYSVFFGTYQRYTISVFYPNLLKNSYLYYYENFKNFYNNNKITTICSNWLFSLSHQYSTLEYCLPDIFRQGLLTEVKNMNNNLVTSTKECLDICNNILFNNNTNTIGVLDLTGATYTFELPTQNGLHEIDDVNRDSILVNMDETRTKVHLVSVKPSYTSTENYNYSTHDGSVNIINPSEELIQIGKIVSISNKMSTLTRTGINKAAQDVWFTVQKWVPSVQNAEVFGALFSLFKDYNYKYFNCVRTDSKNKIINLACDNMTQEMQEKLTSILRDAKITINFNIQDVDLENRQDKSDNLDIGDTDFEDFYNEEDTNIGSQEKYMLGKNKLIERYEKDKPTLKVIHAGNEILKEIEDELEKVMEVEKILDPIKEIKNDIKKIVDKEISKPNKKKEMFVILSKKLDKIQKDLEKEGEYFLEPTKEGYCLIGTCSQTVKRYYHYDDEKIKNGLILIMRYHKKGELKTKRDMVNLFKELNMSVLIIGKLKENVFSFRDTFEKRTPLLIIWHEFEKQHIGLVSWEAINDLDKTFDIMSEKQNDIKKCLWYKITCVCFRRNVGIDRAISMLGL